MLAPSLALEKELCKRRIKVIEFLEQNFHDDMNNDDLRFIEDWLREFPGVVDRAALVDSLAQVSNFDGWMRARSRPEQQ